MDPSLRFGISEKSDAWAKEANPESFSRIPLDADTAGGSVFKLTRYLILSQVA
jgi:hypothetical protein